MSPLCSVEMLHYGLCSDNSQHTGRWTRIDDMSTARVFAAACGDNVYPSDRLWVTGGGSDLWHGADTFASVDRAGRRETRALMSSRRKAQKPSRSDISSYFLLNKKD